MGRYGFTSSGAAGGNAIVQFLMQRAMQQRQASQDAVAQQEREQQAKEHAAELELRKGQERRIAEAQKATMDDLANQREFGRATTISENAMPGDPADETTRGLLEKQGYGGQVKKVPGVVSQGAFQGNDESGIPQYNVNQSPDSFQMRGGSKYLAQQEAERARAAEAEKTRTDVDARGESDRALRLLIAEMAASGKAGQSDLSNQLKQIQIDREREKLDTAKQTRDAAGNAVKTSRATVRDMAQSLLDDPALDGITGSFEGRRDTFFEGHAVDAKRRLDQLVGNLSLQARGQMKGQGQISDFEGRLLSNAVTAIDRAAGPEVVKKHLKEIVDAFSGDAPRDEPTKTPAPGGGSFRVVGVR